MNLEQIREYIPFILEGITVTLQYTFAAAIVGFIWGTILALFKISSMKPLKWFAVAYTSIFRGTPLILQLMIAYNAIPQLTGYQISPFQAALLAFGLNSAAYISETIRAGIMAIDKGQIEAAMSLGIPYSRMMIHIVLPQAMKNILPALVNESIALLKESALVSTIGVMDLLRRADYVGAKTYLYFEPYLIAGMIYYVLVMALTGVAKLLERRLRRSD
ncbi:amino acid ABC transporter permease [Marinicrinis sediminis]|uniref:Amino acid ABC transporter permease n=1 Tax=Marinicrinis sediminis TaxID=1652465 RepID=A0ABW5R5R1_9BACL